MDDLSAEAREESPRGSLRRRTHQDDCEPQAVDVRRHWWLFSQPRRWLHGASSQPPLSQYGVPGFGAATGAPRAPVMLACAHPPRLPGTPRGSLFGFVGRFPTDIVRLDQPMAARACRPPCGRRRSPRSLRVLAPPRRERSLRGGSAPGLFTHRPDAPQPDARDMAYPDQRVVPEYLLTLRLPQSSRLICEAVMALGRPLRVARALPSAVSHVRCPWPRTPSRPRSSMQTRPSIRRALVPPRLPAR